MRTFPTLSLAMALATVALSLPAQQLTTRCDPPPGSLASLSKAQQRAFMKSQDAFIRDNFADALDQLRDLLKQAPQNTPAQAALAERTAEAAIYAGQQIYAISLLQPIEARDGNDCPARTLLARAYAETGQTAKRDAEIDALTALHKEAPESPVGKLDAFLLERDPLKRGATLGIWYALKPFSALNTHVIATVANASGGIIIGFELDSSDGDQVYFRQTHPDLAAKGERQYSLDAFGPKHEHALIQFYVGAPSYDTVRKQILTLAQRAAERAK